MTVQDLKEPGYYWITPGPCGEKFEIILFSDGVISAIADEIPFELNELAGYTFIGPLAMPEELK